MVRHTNKYIEERVNDEGHKFERLRIWVDIRICIEKLKHMGRSECRYMKTLNGDMHTCELYYN